MNPLHRRLAALRRRLRVITISRGVSAVLIVVLGITILAGLLDWQAQLPSLVRAFLLVGMLAGAAFAAVRFLFMPLAVRSDNLSLALRVEECYPELNDALASTVQFLQQTSEERTSTGSPTLRREAAKQAMKLAEKCDFRKAVSSRGLGWMLLGVTALSLVVGLVIASSPDLAGTALWRLYEPFGGHTWTVLRLDDCPTRVAVEQPYVIRGELAGIVPDTAHIEVQSAVETERVLPVKLDEDKKSGSLLAGLDMTQHKGRFRFRLRAGDAQFPRHGGWHEVEVVPPPEWVALNGFPSPQLELHPPAYTQLPSPTKLTPGTRHLDVIEGTVVRLQAATDRPIASAWIEFRPGNDVLLSAMLSPLGATNRFGALASASGGHTIWGRTPAQLSKDGKSLSLTFQPRVSGAYVVYLQDAEKLTKKYESDLRVQFDPIPIVQMERPASSQEVLAGASVALRVRVSDEQFAVRSVFLEYRRRSADRNWLDATPQRLPLYQSGAERQQQVEVEKSWSLAGLVEEGQTLVIAACADDFNDVITNAPGRSGEVELRVVSSKQLARIHDDRLGEIQQELLRLQRMQEQALRTVEQVQKNPGKDDYKKVAEAEQQQKQIRERVGMNKEDGVRGAVNRLQQALRDNELPPSNLRDQLRTLDSELQRILEEDLQQIEPNLAEARKEMDGGKQDKIAALDKAQTLQDDAKKSFDELLKFLDPWASINVVKSQARELLKEQRDLKQSTEKLLGLEKDPGKLEAEAAKVGDIQKELAERTQNLIDTMKQAGESRELKGETQTGKLLKDAAELAKKAALPETMREARDSLNDKNPKLNDALNKQQKSIDELEKVIAALEQRREDEIARLMKKQAEAQKKLEEFVERLEKKRPQTPEEKDKTKQELKKLEEELKQTARELTQMQAEKAGQALNRAAQKLERALRQLEKNEDAEEAQQEARKEVENAAEELAEAEEELAREQLARIGDLLKALKERQAAAIVESRRLHQESIEKRKKWTAPLLLSLRDLSGTQRGLADEADGLQKKLEGALVFEHIMQKAAEQMRAAAEMINERKENGTLRTLELEEEELADEEQVQTRTLDLQQQAADRLDRLLESMKDAKPQLAKKDNDAQQPKNKDGNEKQGASRPAGDNIPDAAQLKALRAEQRDLNDRTNALSLRQRTALIGHGGALAGAVLPQPLPPLNPGETEELAGLRDEQAALQDLLIQITTAVRQQGDQP